MKVWIAAPLAMLVSANLMAAERVEHGHAPDFFFVVGSDSTHSTRSLWRMSGFVPR